MPPETAAICSQWLIRSSIVKALASWPELDESIAATNRRAPRKTASSGRLAIHSASDMRLTRPR